MLFWKYIEGKSNTLLIRHLQTSKKIKVVGLKSIMNLVISQIIKGIYVIFFIVSGR